MGYNVPPPPGSNPLKRKCAWCDKRLTLMRKSDRCKNCGAPAPASARPPQHPSFKSIPMNTYMR